jgi:hypothetical protein
MTFLAPLAARLAGPLLPFVIAGSLGLATGAGLVIAWEHKAPFGLGLAQKLAKAEGQRDALKDKLKGAEADVAKVAAMTHDWAGAYQRLEGVREGEARTCAASLAANANFYKGRCDAAFAAGVSAGKVIGGRANAGSSHSGGVSDPGGVRDDFRAAWGGVGSDSAPR